MYKSRVSKVRAVVFSTAALAALIPGSSASAAPSVWTIASGGNGHAYEAVSAGTGISWDDAKAAAISKGGTLATITSAEENSFVFALTDSTTYWYPFSDTAAIGPWLGGFQPDGSPEPAGGWKWVTGEPFVYTNWAAGQPDNFSAEDHLQFYGNVGRTPTWNDLQANGGVLPTSYVVEYVPEPASATIVCAASLLLFHRRRPTLRLAN
jgi:hypothetical protein